MVPTASEQLFSILGFPVTNTMINTWVAVVFFLILAAIFRGRASLVPGKLQNFIESVLEWLMGYFDQVTGSREKTQKFLPLVASLFMFILFSNWLGLLPGTGSITFTVVKNGVAEAVPLLRPAASDLNTTLALAIFAVVASHIFGIRASGFFKHLNKYFKIGDLWHSFRKGPIAVFTAVTEMGVGLIEIIGEFAKMLSLSLRLYGNVFAGEVLITVIAGLVAFLAPLPFMALEILVGLIQASIFSILTLVYLTIATSEPAAEH